MGPLNRAPNEPDRIVELAGERGLRLVVTYREVALLALTNRRDESRALSLWRRAIPALLDLLDGLG